MAVDSLNSCFINTSFLLFCMSEMIIWYPLFRNLFDHIELLIVVTASHALIINSQTGDVVDICYLTGMPIKVDFHNTYLVMAFKTLTFKLYGIFHWLFPIKATNVR